MVNVIENILIVCPSMCSQIGSWGETQRMYYLANFLSQNGFHVCTVAPSRPATSMYGQKETHYTSYFLGGSKGNAPTTNRQNSIKSMFSVKYQLRKIVSCLISSTMRWAFNEPNCYDGFRKQFWAFKYKEAIFFHYTERTCRESHHQRSRISLALAGKKDTAKVSWHPHYI